MRFLPVLAVLAALPLTSVAADAEAPHPASPAEAPAAPQTSVASSRSRQLRESPGVVTVLTRDELLESGARDLSEVLARVPGFQLGLDVSSAIGAGFRGIWGHEGKILYLVDGIELNDLSYGTFPLLQHVRLEELDRIEIVRGPGSALYGGQAELAVVNVVTRAATVAGASFSIAAGRVERAASASALSLAAGGTREALRFGATASLGDGAASDRTYADFQGGEADLADASRVRPALVTARASWRDLEVRALYDDYRLRTRDGYGEMAPRPVQVRWRTAALDARASLDVGGNVTLSPRLVYRWEQPWQALVPDLEDTYYDVTNERLTGRLAATWDSLAGPMVQAGAEVSLERGRVNEFSNGLLSYAGERTVRNTIVAGFAEAGVDTRWANLLAGARLEHHSAFGSAFVPRLAVTRVLDPFHAKLLASGAYRAPSIENVNYAAGDIRAERTWVLEGEVGWQPSDAISATVNLFDVTVDRPIVFAFDGADVYTNEDRTGSRGLEAELRLQRGIAGATLSYSFYTADGKNRVPAYAVAGDEARLAGFAGHKVVAAARVRPLPGLVVSPAVTFLSERAAFDGSEAPGEPAAGRVGARTYLDLFVGWQDLGTPGLELGAGVRDLLDEGTVFVQPYGGGHAPLPGNGREVWVRLRYDRG